MEAVREYYPSYKILLTFFSPSGYEIRRNYSGADWVFYLPADTPRNAARFLDTVKPEMAVFIKYEFWLNYLAELSRREVPTYIISAVFRPDSIFSGRGGELSAGRSVLSVGCSYRMPIRRRCSPG